MSIGALKKAKRALENNALDQHERIEALYVLGMAIDLQERFAPKEEEVGQ